MTCHLILNRLQKVWWSDYKTIQKQWRCKHFTFVVPDVFVVNDGGGDIVADVDVVAVAVVAAAVGGDADDLGTCHPNWWKHFCNLFSEKVKLNFLNISGNAKFQKYLQQFYIHRWPNILS